MLDKASAAAVAVATIAVRPNQLISHETWTRFSFWDARAERSLRPSNEPLHHAECVLVQSRMGSLYFLRAVARELCASRQITTVELLAFLFAVRRERISAVRMLQIKPHIEPSD